MVKPKAMSMKKLGVGRRGPDDPFFAAGDAVCKALVRQGIVSLDEELLCHKPIRTFPCDVLRCKKMFESLLDYELHYNSCHRFKCSQCNKPLPSPHLLDLHLMEKHDSFFLAQAERKPMFRCYVEDCNVKSANPSERRTHCIQEHNFPHDFRFDESKKGKQNIGKMVPKKKYKHDKKKTSTESKMELEDGAGGNGAGLMETEAITHTAPTVAMQSEEMSAVAASDQPASSCDQPLNMEGMKETLPPS